MTSTVATQSIYDRVQLPTAPFPRAMAVRNRACEETGFARWDSTSTLMKGIRGELDELKETLVENQSHARKQDELGDVLFYVATLAEQNGLDPDAALLGASDKFIKRFRIIEQIRQEQPQSAPPYQTLKRPQWMALWAEAKQRLATTSKP